MSEKVVSTKVITGPGTQFSYCYPFEPRSINGSVPKYSCQLKIPKSDTKTVEAIRDAIRAAYAEGESKLKGSAKAVPPLSSLKTPLRDGDVDRAGESEYAGYWFLNANSTTPVGVVDAQCNPIFDQSEVYSGCFGRASISFFPPLSGMAMVFSCFFNHKKANMSGCGSIQLSCRASCT